MIVLIEDAMSKTTISKRCGKGTCEFYDSQNKVSGCKIFYDRAKCAISMKQRKRTAKKGIENNKNPRYN